DTKTLLPGGSGQKFDWSSLSAYRGTTPFLLSGGISPDDADRVEAFIHERCIGIDLNSRFETSPANKDIHLLQSFIEKIKRK
ncbi:MAG: phosphoribosylanthranilate isomerase, partial [Paludibacteraceae bacterium]|nr:phosphoribosylanthranilate isomerase [Paludibacteraceae bacterium]